MPRNSSFRLYATFRNTNDLLAIYRRGDLNALNGVTAQLLRAARDRGSPGKVPTVSAAVSPSGGLPDVVFNAVSAPSLDRRSAFVSPRAGSPPGSSGVASTVAPDTLIVAYEFADVEHARTFLQIVNDNRDVPLDAAGNAFRGAGFDPGGEIADHWCPGPATLMFGNREHARRTVRASALAEHGLLGQNVNVVIIDQGLSKAHIPSNNWGGGLDHFIDADQQQPAGTAPRTSHGMMIARSILDLAPAARLYDVPMISATKPPNIPVFVSTAEAAFASLMQEISQRRELPEWSGPWILVNAWGIFDTSLDPSGSYTENKESHGHPLINLVTRAVEDDRLDVIFAAGNCGEFCPSRRCGGLDRGPGRGIWGANAHPKVLTVGAVRSDETWIGYSSQGPGPELLAVEKPDICAPSQFRETYDAAVLSSGTSAACGLVAGIVAALRANPKWNQTDMRPDAMKAALIASARKPDGPSGWDNRLGHGIIDVAAAISKLPP